MARMNKIRRPPWLPKKSHLRKPPLKEAGKERSNNYDLYNSTKWRRYSIRYRRDSMVSRLGYGCEVSHHEQEDRPAQVTDHIVPINQGGAIWDARNHMAMSHHYHNRKRGYESHGLVVKTREGIDGLIPHERIEIIKILINGKQRGINE